MEIKTSPHKVTNFVRVFAFGEHKDFQHFNDEEWPNRLYPKYAESNEISVNSGTYVSLSDRAPKDTIDELFKSIKNEYRLLEEYLQELDKSKHLKSSSYSVGKKKYSELEKKVKSKKTLVNELRNKLNIDGELDSVQKNLSHDLIYVPWYIVRLDKPNSHRYLAIDHLGNIDDYFSKRITHWDHIYDLLVRYSKEI